MKIATIVNNFARGQADHDLNGRFDLPIYATSSEIFKNFYGNFKGNALFRCGLEKIVKFEDCRFIEFKFNKEQSYICAFYDQKIKFLTYDASGNLGWVQSGGSDLVVTTPYSLSEAKELDFTQNADVMYLTHPSYDVYKLTRTSATTFTMATFTRTADPFTGVDKYPALCQFYTGYLYYAATNEKLTTIWRSKAGDYDDMTTGSADDDGLEFAVAELTEKFLWLKGGNKSLIGGSSQGLVTINGGGAGEPITPSTVSATLTNTDGASANQPIRQEDLLFYVNTDQRNVKYFSYDILTESFKTQDASVVSYDIGRGKFAKMVFKQDRNNLIWILKENGKLCALNFNQTEKIVGWSEHESEADFKDISLITNNEGVEQLFTLMKYGSDYYICRLSEQPEFKIRDNFYTGVEDSDDEAYYKYTAEVLKQCNYLDISQDVSDSYTSTITYVGLTEAGSTGTITSTASDFSSADVGKKIWYRTSTGYEWGVFLITGYTNATTVAVRVEAEPTASSYSDWYKDFTTISGLTDFIGEEMSVVGDGGYKGDYTVDASGEIELENPITHGWVGFKYEGLIKGFNLGFQVQAVNTQFTPKNISRFGVRFVFSAGGEIGTTQYNMEPMQEFSPFGYFDLPPIPMDGTKYINYGDTFDREKSLYIKQAEPLPLNVTAVLAEVNYGTKH